MDKEEEIVRSDNERKRESVNGVGTCTWQVRVVDDRKFK